MATATKTRSKKTTKGTSTAKNATAKATKTADDGPSKRELQKARDAELTVAILERRENDEKWGEIASDLSITPGKAQFLVMLHQVAEGEVDAIDFDDDDELTAGIIEAREATDEHSSWGWIAARTGVSEGKVKALAEAAGHEVAGSKIAVARAEANGGGEKADGKTAKQASRKTGKTAAKGKPASKVARAKSRAKKSADVDPS